MKFFLPKRYHLLDQFFSVAAISIVAGFGGSLHCVGMCGGLVTASCEKSNEVLKYQIGRLLGYLTLGFFAGILGGFLSLKNLPPFYSVIPALMIGSVFIFMGIKNFRNQKADFPAPKFLKNMYLKLWEKLVKNNRGFSKAFFVGAISILLPCGLLYGVVLGTLALQSSTLGMISMFFFWLGTLPSMLLAPGIVQKILKPLKLRLPKTYAISLVTIGLMTITFRLANFHSKSVNEASPGNAKIHKCH